MNVVYSVYNIYMYIFSGSILDDIFICELRSLSEQFRSNAFYNVWGSLNVHSTTNCMGYMSNHFVAILIQLIIAS